MAVYKSGERDGPSQGHNAVRPVSDVSPGQDKVMGDPVEVDGECLDLSHKRGEGGRGFDVGKI